MAKEQKILLTPEGLAKVKKELSHLVIEVKPNVARKIQQALEEGNPDDNLVYDSALEEMEGLNRRVAELENIIRSAEVNLPLTKPNVVDVGTTVMVEVDGQLDTYTIVGSLEASPFQGRISHESPVGKAIMGKKVGEEVKVTTPYAIVRYKIVKID